MNNLENWTEVTKGLYRYVIAANCCYEIHVLHWDHGTDILTAKASLYLVGDWFNTENKTSYFERECLLSEQSVFKCLLSEQSVFECLKAAVDDDRENNSHD